MPLAIVSVKNIHQNTYNKIIIILNYSLFFPAFVSVYNYLLNKKLFDSLILESKPLPIEFGYGIYHIQFSIILALSIVFGVFQLYYYIKLKHYKTQFWILLMLCFSNFLFIHILSARTGLLALYAGLLVFIIHLFQYISKAQKLKLAIVSISIPILLYISSSSLQNRVTNTIQDFKVVWQNTNANDYSFAMRVKAWKNSIDIIQKYPILGVGIGDADSVLYHNFEKVDASILPQNRRNPHFQFLETWVQSGILSALLFLITLLFSIFHFKQHRNWIFIAICILLLLSSCFESILERQASVVAFAFFIALAYFYSVKQTNDSH